MGKIFHIVDEVEEYRGGYNQKETEDNLLEKAFKEGCDHGYNKAMRELETYNERKAKPIVKDLRKR